MTDAELAAMLAEAAGQALAAVAAQGALAGVALGAEGDRLANKLILDGIRKHRPDDGVLSEESADDGARLGKSRVWIVDPLDGTREYAEGRDDWAVHVGLAVDGAPAAGAVAVPRWNLVLRSDRISPPFPSSGPPRLLVSRSRPAPEVPGIAEALGAEVIPMGSAGAKTAAVMTGKGDLYVHAGGQFEWDNCAPAAVALAAGLHASRLDGSPLHYNHKVPYVPDLLIGDPGLARRALDVLAAP